MWGELGDDHVLAGVPQDRVAQQAAALAGVPSHAVRELALLQLGAISTALELGAPELVAEERRWLDRRLAATGEPLTADALRDAVAEALEEHVGADLRRRVEQLLLEADAVEVVEPTPPAATAASRAYLGAALAGRRDEAARVVQDAMAQGRDVAEIVLRVLQPAQVELGRLWESGEVDVAAEHRVTATTQLCLGLLYPLVAAGAGSARRSMVAATVGAESHDLGIRMITDLMESEGWSTAFLGATVPTGDLVTFVRHRRPDVLALSTTMARHLVEVRAVVRAVRADPTSGRVRILVGGRPFAQHPRLAQVVGADATAATAEDAVALCRRWAQDDAAPRE